MEAGKRKRNSKGAPRGGRKDTRAALLRGLIEAVATREENSDQGDAVTPRHHVVNVGAHYEPRGSKGPHACSELAKLTLRVHLPCPDR